MICPFLGFRRAFRTPENRYVVWKVRSFATPLFNFRWWLARDRVAPDACGCGLRPGRKRESDSIERSTTAECDDSGHPLAGSGNPVNRRLMDTNRRSLGSPHRSLEDTHATRRQVALAHVGDRGRRPGNVRTRALVRRCSSLRLETLRTHTPQIE